MQLIVTGPETEFSGKYCGFLALTLVGSSLAIAYKHFNLHS